MRSRAHFRTHPIHPMLIPFPIAFLTGAFFFNLVGLLTGAAAWWETGWRLAGLGILTGIVAAIPGFIDYLYSVPPRSSAKQRTTRHALVNVGALLLFGVAILIRGEAAAAPGTLTLLLEAAGIGCLVAGGWMGGTLVYRNHIGVFPRYANLGKWQESRVPAQPEEPIVVAQADELEIDQMKLLHVNGKRLVLARTEEGYVAFDDHCTHKGGSLASGMMICGTVQCPWHGSQFDVKSGSVKAGPAEKGISTYEVTERDGAVLLRL